MLEAKSTKNSMALQLLIVTLIGMRSVFLVHGQHNTDIGELSPELEECLQLISSSRDSNVTMDTRPDGVVEEMQSTCLQEIVWKFGAIQWADFNITEKDIRFINSLTHSLVQEHNRVKRQAGPGSMFPRTGFRIRREYRRLTDRDRFFFHEALNALKRNGQFDTFANLHRGTVITTAHRGPNFFGWHRVYLALIEEALRRINRRVSIPYWDSSLDFDMDNPVNSIIWSAPFLGNGDGFVTTGPFANWETPVGPLAPRSINNQGETIGIEEALRRINRRVSIPYWDSSLDFDMDNPVNSIIWSAPFLGNGDGFVTTGPFANWETPVGPLARNIAGGSRLLSKEVIRQILTRCRTSEISNPTAEPQFNLELAHGGPHVWVGGQMSGLNTAAHDPTFLLHHAFIDYLWEIFRIRQARRCGVNPNTDYPPMVPQHERDRVMDGFPQYRNIDGYRGYWTRFWFRYERSPSCNRFRPFCGTPYLRCDVRRGRCVSVARRMMDRNTGRTMMAFGAPSVARASRARAQASSLRIGPMFAAPPSDGRTQDAGFRRAGRRRRAVNQTENNPVEIIKPFVAPPSDGRTSDVLGFNIAHGIPSNDPVGPQPERPGEILYSYAAPMPLIPLPEFSNSSRQSNDHKTPVTLGQQSTDQTIYVPVGIIYRRSSNRPIAGSYCIGEINGLMRIHVKSEGLTYQGVYENFTFVDTRPSYQASTIYMAVQVSKSSASDVLLTARDECGRMCQPVCLNGGEIFEPCDGTLQIDSNIEMYGRSVEEAARRLWTGSGLFGVGMTRRVEIQFICPMEGRQRWDLNRMF